MVKDKEEKYKILCLIGGGIKGVIQARIMERLKLQLSDFNMVSGTSAGSINAGGFACCYSNSELVDFYKKEGKKIFKRKSIFNINLLQSKYDIKALEKVLKNYYKNETLGSIKKWNNIDMIIPTFCLDKIDSDSGARVAMPKVYSSFTEADLDIPLYEIVCMSSAAPTYFQSYKNYIDGGVYANDPSIEAVSAAIHSGVDPKSIEVITIGTGIADNSVKPKNWGLAQWAPHILSFMFQGTEESSEFCARSIVGKYQKYQIRTKNYKIDDVDKIQDMIDDVDRWADSKGI